MSAVLDGFYFFAGRALFGLIAVVALVAVFGLVYGAAWLLDCCADRQRRRRKVRERRP